MRAKSRQRTHLRWLPHHGVAADQRVRGVPGVDRDWEVKRGNHADHTNWVPGLHETVTRTLRRHGLAVEHAGLSQCEVANVNHFLDFAFSLRNGLAGFNLNQNAQVMLVLCKQLSPTLHHIATPWRWDFAPGLVGFIGSVIISVACSFVVP